MLASILVLSQGAVDNVYEDVVWDRVPVPSEIMIIAMRIGTKDQVSVGFK